ncbi:MAG TPA: arylamine N-acetyltransferase [Acidimicrobiales bacterium]
MPPLDPGVRTAYLERLGLEAEPPSAEALARLHRAHTERVPYETLWIHLGEGWDIDQAGSAARVATRGRGGYCFHLNGAFGALLADLGYEVRRHVGGVHGPDGPAPGDMTNHLVLTVRGLPSDRNPGGRWYVDAGLGDALHEPLPLEPGRYRQGPFLLALDQAPGDVADWHLAHDPSGSFPGMAWRAAAAGMDAFAARHTWLSTSPESGFVRVLTVQRRDATGADVLRGLVLRRVGDGAAETTLGTAGDLFDALGDVFALDPGHLDPAARRALWERVHTAHLAWRAATAPAPP